ncbi:MAG: hypothetical protein JWQ93_1739 [Marmoricola sp.]|nr:hypothetical protein [Marmoricola sp.]MCW2836860.1 hypothetical protein [Marmoricola sp.]
MALMVPLVASLGIGAASPSSGAVTRTQHAHNGGFEAGRAGWVVNTPRTKLRVVQRGVGGSKALMLTNRRNGPASFRARQTLTDSTAAGQTYAVSAYVRTNQPGVVGRLVLRETASGQPALETSKGFHASRDWSKVSLTAVTRRSASQLEVRFRVYRLHKRRSILVDNVSVVQITPTDPGSATPPPPVGAPPVTTPPVVTPPVTSPGARTMSNGCAMSARGIPVASCGALLGSAYGSNTDPTPWEAEMGHALGVRRTYYGATQVDKGVSVAKTDLAKHRVPWISYKLPYSWADMVAGKGDAWTLDLATKLSKLNGPVWLAFHHEPEGDGDITLWTAMQARLAPIVRAAAPNVSYSIVVTGWNQLYGPAQYSLDAIWPKNTKIDLLGVDVYNKLGAVKNGVEYTKATDMEGDYFKPFSAWAKKNGVAWGVAETGFTDKAAEVDPQWVSRSYTQLRALGGVAFTYFNTNLNSIANWALTTETKKRVYKDALSTTPVL